MALSQIQPGLLRKMTVRKVLESLQEHGPLSRADLTRETGISAPTVSKVVADLLDSGLLEEGTAPDNTVGRPGKKIQLARDRAQVIGVTLDAQSCVVVAASLDGKIDEERTAVYATPGSYDALMDTLTPVVQKLQHDSSAQTLGVGISIPGLIDAEHERCLFSPNLQIINTKQPAADLAKRTGLETTCMQETKALCMAERLYGKARGLENFAMMDITGGLGLGVFSAGELLLGHTGLAGELGHITVDPTGPLCGCGNRGCLETLASDAALTAMLSERLNRKLSIDDVIPQLKDGQIQATEELNKVCEYLSIAVSAAVNLFNPSTLFLHGRLLSINDVILEQVVRMAQKAHAGPDV